MSELKPEKPPGTQSSDAILNAHAELLGEVGRFLNPQKHAAQAIRAAEALAAPDGSLIPSEFRAQNRDVREKLFEKFAASTNLDSLTRIVAFEQDAHLRRAYCETIGRALNLGVFGAGGQAVVELLSAIARSPTEQLYTRENCASSVRGELYRGRISEYVFLDSAEVAILTSLKDRLNELAPKSDGGIEAKAALDQFAKAKGIRPYP